MINFEFRKNRKKRKNLGEEKIEKNILEKNDVSNVIFLHLNDTINVDIIFFTNLGNLLSILRFIVIYLMSVYYRNLTCFNR